jgi:6-phospho-3-hexuloisomerase
MQKSFGDLAAALVEELGEALRSVDPGDVAELRGAILRAERVFVAGKGRSGLQMRGFGMRLMHLGLRVHVLGDVTTPAIAEGDLLLIGSGSGRTKSLVVHAERAKELGTRVALITAARSSPITARADHVVHVAVRGERTPGFAPTCPPPTQPMGSLFEQTLGAVLDIVVLQLIDEMGVGVEEMFARHANLE